MDLIEAASSGLVGKVALSEDRPLDRSDFAFHAPKALEALARCDSLLKEDSFSTRDDLSWLVPVLCLCGENASPYCVWSSKDLKSATEKTLSKIMDILGESSVGGILMSTANSVLKPGDILRKLLETLKANLSKKDFKKFPGAVAAMSWAMNELTFPYLGDFIGDFLPFCLTLTDDWQLQNKLLGLACIGHLIANVGGGELRSFGRNDVIQNALETMLVHKEVEVVEALYPVTLSFLRLHVQAVDAAKTCRADATDRLASKLLQSIELESKLEVKRSLCKQLVPLFRALGPRSARWLSRFCRVFETVMAYADVGGQEACRRDALQCLDLLFEHKIEERLKEHAKELLMTLFRLLYEVSGDDVKWGLLGESNVEAIKKLKNIIEVEKWESYTKGLNDVHVNVRFEKVMNRL